MRPMDKVVPALLASNVIPSSVALQKGNAAIRDGTTKPTRWPASTKIRFVLMQNRIRNGHRQNFDMARTGILHGIRQAGFFNVEWHGFAQAEAQQRNAIFFAGRKFLKIDNGHAHRVIGNDQSGVEAARAIGRRYFRQRVAEKLRPDKIGQTGRGGESALVEAFAVLAARDCVATRRPKRIPIFRKRDPAPDRIKS